MAASMILLSGQDALSRVGVLVIGRLDLTIVARLAIALVLCGAIGLERSRHDRASGLRTHILVGVGACLMTLAGGYGFAELHHTNTDPMRVASYVVSGIGFLGAGAILRHGATVRGMTTAASLWGVAGVGIAVGVGMAGLAIVAVVLILFTLVPLQRWESRLRFLEESRGLTIHLRDDNEAVGKTLAALGRLGVRVRQTTVLPGAGDTAILHVELSQALQPGQVERLSKRLLTLRYIERVEAGLLELDIDVEDRSLDGGEDGNSAVTTPDDLLHPVEATDLIPMHDQSHGKRIRKSADQPEHSRRDRTRRKA